MVTCETWQAPFKAGNAVGSTDVGACQALRPILQNDYGDTLINISFNSGICHIEVPEYEAVSDIQVLKICDAPQQNNNQNQINCDGACTVAIELKAAEPDAEKLTDMSQLWGLFLVVLVVIYCTKQILKFFESTPHGD